MGKVIKAVISPISSSKALKAAAGAALTIGGALTGNFALVASGISLTSSALAKKPKSVGASSDQLDRLILSVDPRSPRKWVFGTTAMATDLRDQEFTDDQLYLHRFVVVASHKVHQISEIWFDENLAWSLAGGVTSDYAGYLQVTPVLEGSAANAINISPRMGTTRRFTGCAYLHIRYRLKGLSKKTESPFATSIPNRITVRGNGAYFYDPRLDGTAGGSGSCRANDQTTWVWNGTSNNNAALVLLNYLLGWRINGKLAVGKGIPANRLDMPAFITAANLCDEPVALAGGGTEPRYRAAGVASEGQRPEEVIAALKSAMNADVDDIGGKIRPFIFYNDLASPVCHFTADDIIEGAEWNPTANLESSFNIVRGGHPDPSNEALYQIVDYPEAKLPAEPADGIDRVDTFDLSYVESTSQCQRLAKTRLVRGQYGAIFKAVFQSTAWKAQKNDPVTLTFDRIGAVARKFRVSEMPITQDGRVNVILREEHEAIYAWDASESVAIPSYSPTPWDFTKSALVEAIQDATAAGAFTLLPVANVEFPTPNSVRKTGTNNAWDAKAYTRESSTSGARITWIITGARQGGGLTTDPTADADWTSVDYWMQPSEAGVIGIYRNGSHLGNFGAWAAGDVLSVHHDAKTVRYYRNGALIYSHPVNSATETVYGVFNLYSPGATITDISYSTGGAAGQDGADGDPGAASAGAIIDPGFETGTFENWRIVPNSGSINLQSAAGRTGTYAARIEYGSPFAPYILSNKWPCAAGQKWHLSAWVKRDEAAPPNNLIQLYAVFFDAAGTQNNAAALTTASHLISGWQLMTGEVTVPSGSPQMALDVGEAVGSGAWLVDDCFAVMRGQDGAAGYSYAELTIFKQSATAPATPTGGSYNFATKTTTPPSGWGVDPSSFSGPDPVYSAKQTAAVQGATGTVSLGAWSSPGVVFASGADGQDGQSVDIVYRRSATQPATPSPSAGVPSGFYGQVADVPASADPMWQSTGERADPLSNFVWQMPLKAEGKDGADGADGVKTFTSETAPTAEKIGDFWVKPSTGELRRWDGTSWGEPIADVTSLAAPRVDGPHLLNFSADFMGAISPSSQLPKTINISRFRGDVDVSSSTTWSIASQGPISGGTVTVSSMGVVTIPEGVSIAATGNLIIRSVRDTVTIDHQMTVSKTNAQAPNTGGSGGSGTTSTDPSLNDVTTTTFIALTEIMTVKTGSAGQITLSASDLRTFVPISGNLGSFPTELRWGVRPIGGSFTYQATTSDTSPASVAFDSEVGARFAESGSISNNQLVTGLSANTNYEVQLEGRRSTATPAKTVSFGGTAAAVGG